MIKMSRSSLDSPPQSPTHELIHGRVIKGGIVLHLTPLKKKRTQRGRRGGVRYRNPRKNLGTDNEPGAGLVDANAGDNDDTCIAALDDDDGDYDDPCRAGLVDANDDANDDTCRAGLVDANDDDNDDTCRAGPVDADESEGEEMGSSVQHLIDHEVLSESFESRLEDLVIVDEQQGMLKEDEIAQHLIGGLIGTIDKESAVGSIEREQLPHSHGSSTAQYSATFKERQVIHAITAMREYSNKSFEEIRLEDYAVNNRGTKSAFGDRTLIGDQTESFMCRICEVPFANQVLLKKHISSGYHEEQVRILYGRRYCDVCHMMFAHARHYKRHLGCKDHVAAVKKTHRSKKKSKFWCEVCKSGFRHRRAYDGHVFGEKHSNVTEQQKRDAKRWILDDNDAAFPIVRGSEAPPSLNNLCCDICNKTFESKKLLDDHLGSKKHKKASKRRARISSKYTYPMLEV